MEEIRVFEGLGCRPLPLMPAEDDGRVTVKRS